MESESVVPSLEQLDVYEKNVCLAVPQSVIAEEFGVSQQTISNWVVIVREYMRYAKRETISTLRADLTERYEALYRESMRAWKRSQDDEVVTTESVGGKEDTTTTRTTPQVGSPAFLKISMDAIKGIRDLWSAEMSATDRRGESRSVGKTQAERIDQKIEELQRAKAKLAARQNGGGSGGKA